MERSIRKAFPLVLAVALLPGVAAAQAPEERIERALARALEAGVPVELLESKVAEGRAKNIPLDRIALAVERRLESLEQVKASVGDRHGMDAQELGVSADAVQAGVSQAVLEAIAERAPRERRSVAIAALTQLVALGHASEVALERVTEALARGPEALMNLPAQAQAQGRGRGGPPADVPGRGSGAQSGRGGPPPSLPPSGTDPGRGRGRGGPPPGEG